MKIVISLWIIFNLTMLLIAAVRSIIYFVIKPKMSFVHFVIYTNGQSVIPDVYTIIFVVYNAVGLLITLSVLLSKTI